MKNDVLLQVRAYALDNYNHGWDAIVEAYTDAELLDYIGGRSFEDFISFHNGVTAGKLEREAMQGWDF